ncbi:MAG: hypothetical protein WC813_01130 [Patescibacteria group bacterium]|jgi:hypothetical protein
MNIPFFRIAATAICSLGFLLISSTSVFAADSVRPTVGTVLPTSAVAGVPVNITVSYADDDSGVTLCELYVEFNNEGVMTLSGGVASRAYTFPSKGVYTLFVHCKDAAGNAQNGHNTAVNVSAAPNNGDVIVPVVGQITPAAAQINVAVNLQASYSDAGGVTACRLIVGGFDNGAMTLSAGVASRSFVFDSTGSYSVHAQCVDAGGNIGVGSSVTVVVSSAAVPSTVIVTPVEVVPPTAAPTTTPGLVKLICPSVAAADHPCHSVYYRASDGTRHAFPNERVFLTWYSDFSSVTEISSSDMAALQLGKNVTYRPGVRMVKFTTDNKVYAVDQGGVLRWVSSEAMAMSLYGSDWNKKIDDIADVFVSNYDRTGAEIMNDSDYSPSIVTNEVESIEENF